MGTCRSTSAAAEHDLFLVSPGHGLTCPARQPGAGWPLGLCGGCGAGGGMCGPVASGPAIPGEGQADLHARVHTGLTLAVFPLTQAAKGPDSPGKPWRAWPHPECPEKGGGHTSQGWGTLSSGAVKRHILRSLFKVIQHPRIKEEDGNSRHHRRELPKEKVKQFCPRLL